MRTRSNVFAIALTVSLLAPSAGCGGVDCVDSCEATNKCGQSHIGDCDAYCEQLDQVNEDSGCADRYETLNECADEQDDICAAYRTSCESELRSYNDCYQKYCADHQGTCPKAE
jgi:hypothetical protein